MKNITIIFLIAAVAALGALCVHQRNQLAQTNARLAAIESQLKEIPATDDKAAYAERKAKLLQDTLTETAAAAAKQSKQVTVLEQSLAEAQTNAGTGKGLSDLFKDPEMKEMIKSQQKLFLGPMIDKMYAPLFQQLKLTPEQAAALKELLEKKMGAAGEMGMSMMGSDMDAAKRTELAKQVKEQNDAFNAQIKESLGSDNYQAYEAYEKTTPDRMALSQIRDQLGGTSTALTPDQEQQLVQAMHDERTQFKWSTDYSNPDPNNPDFAGMFSEERVNQFAQEKAKLDQQVLARARQILTPEQLAAFEKSQTMQRQMQINGMKMAAKMFAPKSQ